MKDPNNPCLFCNIRESGLAYENNLAYASYDSYPVSKYHCLVIPKRHIKDYFELTNDELVACNNLIKIVKNEISNKDETRRIAKNGWERGHKYYNEKIVTNYFLEIAFKNKPESDYGWPIHQYFK